MADQPRIFPAEFTWGVATSAYQIEGAADVDGKGPSVWDLFSAEGKVRNGDTGHVACDHYHRYREDCDLMRELGIPNYRLSISWPRVLPTGNGDINELGLDYYDALIDALLERQIQPWVTLFHWDFPQDLQDKGGWLNPQSPRWFAEYVRIVVERLSDRVQHWFTINEPQVFLRYGLVDAINAPGLRLSLEERLLASHNVLLAHGLAVAEIRSVARTTPQVGWAPVGIAMMPASQSAADVEAAELAMSGTPDHLWSNTWFNDPVFLGSYPEAGLREFGSAVPSTTPQEMETISAPLDFLGLNIYTGTYVRSTGDGSYEELPVPPGAARTAFDWPVCEESLYWGARYHWERYKKPIYITENGMANIDWVALDGEVHDPQRIDYLARYLGELHRAIGDGVDVRGYFLWSLLDNFEWSDGYGKRFGLVHVDFETQHRIAKDSARWYREVIQTNGGSLIS
ncbi:GH1 family beta-glucosidase [Bythopirellula polymerisocia]|uniref:Beta-glucosidase n=1 Tax=Bythopirellula polymerisocia TaxID=2528003 RepID=A0A5C6D384_9BACT|nr:GH1 family beta-glucosidase [Bythopirellula polymerisocia]TWU29319.1 Beta-glucosidase A [Bythopirellula polymerisocia]